MSGTFDDSKSVGSTSSTNSVSNAPVSCPYCPTSIAGKYLFKHIHDNHYKELVRNTTLPILKEMHEKQHPFQVQNVKEQSIIGCLSCLKTFTTYSRAISHIHKDGGCLKDHLSKLEKLMKADGQVVDKNERNTIWFKTLCYFLPHIDCYMAKITKSFGCSTDLFDNSILVLKDVHNKIKTADRVETNWCTQFNRIVKNAEQLKMRYDTNNSQGFMSSVSRCKWLPDEKQLDEIMTEADVEYAIKYKLKCVNIEYEAPEVDVVLSVTDFLEAIQKVD